jgi:hypothetical protein
LADNYRCARPVSSRFEHKNINLFPPAFPLSSRLFSCLFRGLFPDPFGGSFLGLFASAIFTIFPCHHNITAQTSVYEQGNGAQSGSKSPAGIRAFGLNVAVSFLMLANSRGKGWQNTRTELVLWQPKHRIIRKLNRR